MYHYWSYFMPKLNGEKNYQEKERSNGIHDDGIFLNSTSSGFWNWRQCTCNASDLDMDPIVRTDWLNQIWIQIYFENVVGGPDLKSH